MSGTRDIEKEAAGLGEGPEEFVEGIVICIVSQKGKICPKRCMCYWGGVWFDVCWAEMFCLESFGFDVRF